MYLKREDNLIIKYNIYENEVETDIRIKSKQLELQMSKSSDRNNLILSN